MPAATLEPRFEGGEASFAEGVGAAPLTLGTARTPLPLGLGVFLLLACSLAMASNGADADLWGHVRYGQDVLEQAALPRTATHTFTAPDFRWVNHENLSEVIFAVLANWGGAPALLGFKFLLGLAVLAAILRSALRQRAGALAAVIVVVLVAVNLTAGWTVRPQLFSYAFFALLIVLLDRSFDAAGRLQNPAWLFLTWPLFAIWANTHGGFLAGLGVFGLYTFGRAAQALWRDGRGAIGAIGCLSVVTLGAAGATLLTPYGVELWQWLIRSLGPPRPEIPEWVGLNWKDAKFVPFAALAGLAVASIALSRRPRDAVQIAVLAVTALQAVAHQRHIPFFALAAGFWIPDHLESLLARWRGGAAEQTNHAPSLLFWAASLVVAAALVMRLGDMPVERHEYPVSALEYMGGEGLHGKLVVTFNWAQYALAALEPATTVAFDGRYDTCYPAEVVDMHFDFVLGDDPARRWRNPASPPFDPARVLEFGQPDLVLIQRTQRPAVSVIERHADWVLLYQDSLAQLLGRRSQYDDPAAARYLPPARRQISDAPQTGSVAWPGFPRPRMTAHERPGAN